MALQQQDVTASGFARPDTAPRKLCAIIANHLRAMIMSGELVEGDSLPTEAVLIEAMQVSRPSLREALRILESEGLISIAAGTRTGAQVRRPSGISAAAQLGWLLQFERCTAAEVAAARAVLAAQREMPVIAVLDRLLMHVLDGSAAIESDEVRQ